MTGIKGNWLPLYRWVWWVGVLLVILCCRHFLGTPNFQGWYSVRREEANQKLRLIHLDMLCKAVSYYGGRREREREREEREREERERERIISSIQDILFWMKDKLEVEIVDFLLQVKECLVSWCDGAWQSLVLLGLGLVHNTT